MVIVSVEYVLEDCIVALLGQHLMMIMRDAFLDGCEMTDW